MLNAWSTLIVAIYDQPVITMPLLTPRYLTLLIILSLIVGTWLARIPISELTITSIMQQYGLSEATSDIRRMGLKQSQISQFGFTLTTGTGLFQLEIKDAVIDYSPEQLAEGRVENLSIEALTIEYNSRQPAQNGQNITGKAVEPIKIIASLRQALREYIIFNRFLVQHLTLTGEAFGVLQDKPLQLIVSNEEGITHAELTILDSETPAQTESPRKLILTQISENHLAAKLELSTTPDSQPATIELHINDTSIEGNYAINPNSLGDWLEPFTDLDGIKQTGKISGSLSVDFEPVEAIKASLTARTDRLAFDPYMADDIFVRLDLNIPHRHPFKLIRLQEGTSIKAKQMGHQSFSMIDTQLNIDGGLTVTDGTWHYKGEASTDALSVNYDLKTLLLNDISAQISADAGSIEINGGLATANLPGRFDFTLAHSFTTKTGDLSVEQSEPIDLNTGDYRLSQLLKPWPYSFDLMAGKISLTAHAAWSQHDDFRLTSTIKLDEAGGQFEELVFSGLSTKHELEILPELRSARTSSITLKHLDSGVTASNINTRLALQTANSGPLPRFKVQDLHGEIFGGSISGSDFVFDLNRRRNSFKISASNIDLAKIVETQQLEDIKVTGRVDGTIPVEINDKGIVIDHGAFLNNVRAGTIRYNPATGTDQLKQNPLTGIALDALKDFRYSHLSADVNFTPEGMLTIKLQLKGTSPELETNRPVHLNISTEQNLFSLLKSLRYAEGISANIDRKVRRQYDKSGDNNQAE